MSIVDFIRIIDGRAVIDVKFRSQLFGLIQYGSVWSLSGHGSGLV